MDKLIKKRTEGVNRLHDRYDAIAMNQSHQNASFLSPQIIELTRWVAVASLLALIFLGLAWELWLAPLREGGSWLAIKVLPLCWPLAGLLKNRMYTYRWVSLMIWLYFTEGVVRAWGDKGWSAGLAMGEVALCLILFAACALHVRWRFQMAKDASPEEAPSAEARAT
jgi:uncharacterized membrane protein